MKYRILFLDILTSGFLLLLILFTMSATNAAGSLTGTKICIDPGHGGSDPGAVNETYNLSESEINLDVSYGLKALLEDDGAIVVLTRTDDTYKENSDRCTFCNYEQATILISIHTNSVVDPTWDGSMALYFHPHENDKILAQAVFDIMYPFLKDTAPDPDNFRSFGLDWFASGVLLKSDMPAAMMEPLFMSNPAEAELLVQRIYDNPSNGTISEECVDFSCRRGQIAESIHLGVLNYFENIEPEPGGSVYVSSIEMWYEKKGANFFINTQVAVYDNDGNPVNAASVTLLTSQPNGSQISSTGITGSDGKTVFRFRSNQSGTFLSTVTNVVKDGWVYDEAANIESTESLTLP